MGRSKRFPGTGRSLGGKVKHGSKGSDFWSDMGNLYSKGKQYYNTYQSKAGEASAAYAKYEPYVNEIYEDTGMGQPYHSIKNNILHPSRWKQMGREVHDWKPAPGSFVDQSQGFFDKVGNATSKFWRGVFGIKQNGDVAMAPSGKRMREEGFSSAPYKFAPGMSNQEKTKAQKMVDNLTRGIWRKKSINPNPSPMPKAPRYRISTTGNYGGAFSGRKRRRVSKASYAGCVLKAEKTGTVTDPACVYVGHVAAPLYQTLRAIGWSIARLVAKYWRQDFTSFLAPMNGPDATSSVSIRVTLTVRTSPTGVCSDNTWTDTSSTWAEFGDNIIHHIISNCAASDIFYEVVRIKFANIDATAVESLQTIILHGDHLKIAVSGYSQLKVQNHTVSTAADTLASENKDDIANNPIIGKQYFGKGHYHSYKFNNDYTTSTPTFYYTTDTGYLTFAPNTATSLETNMKNVLDKPPPFKTWTNMLGQRPAKLMPGQIKYSTVKSRYKFTLNQWIKVLFPTFRNATSLSAVTNATSNFAKISRNSVLAFEHMLYSSSEPDIVIGYQIDLVTTGIAYHKKKMYCVPDFQSATNSLILEEDPAVS